MVGIGEHGEMVLGDELVDSEHRAQMRLLELFEKSLAEGKEKDDLVIILDRLIEFTNLHFMSEEMHMQSHAYPGLGVHAKEHDLLLEQARKMQSVFNADDRKMTAGELSTLRSWLVEHIRTKDQAFVLYMEKQKAGEEF